MKGICTYCNNLHKAIENQNYCSNQGDRVMSVSSNAYYFKANTLNSGEHISRLSIRTVSDAYQSHFVNGEQFVLDKHNYLMVNEGASFRSELDSNNPIEGLVVAFNPDDYNALIYTQTTADINQLDDPFEYSNSDIDFNTHIFPKSSELLRHLELLKYAIKQKNDRKLFFQETFNNILNVIFLDQKRIQKKVNKIEVKKESTKKEIYRRLAAAQNYLDAHLGENICLNTLSSISMLSPFHLQRNFKSFYGLSPLQYLRVKRLERAIFLLRDTHKSVGVIAQEVGFQNQSSFGRLFRSKTGFSPKQFRALK